MSENENHCFELIRVKRIGGNLKKYAIVIINSGLLHCFAVRNDAVRLITAAVTSEAKPEAIRT